MPKVSHTHGLELRFEFRDMFINYQARSPWWKHDQNLEEHSLPPPFGQ